ncbi:hypothetical protein HK097_004205, partial [Rhizophlyctis rosea]
LQLAVALSLGLEGTAGGDEVFGGAVPGERIVGGGRTRFSQNERDIREEEALEIAIAMSMGEGDGGDCEEEFGYVVEGGEEEYVDDEEGVAAAMAASRQSYFEDEEMRGGWVREGGGRK